VVEVAVGVEVAVEVVVAVEEVAVAVAEFPTQD
jgi:hypothetical protein